MQPFLPLQSGLNWDLGITVDTNDAWKLQVFRHIMMPSTMRYLQRYKSSATRIELQWSSILLNWNRTLNVVVVTSSFFLAMSIRRNLVVILHTGLSICYILYHPLILALGFWTCTFICLKQVFRIFPCVVTDLQCPLLAQNKSFYLPQSHYC